MWNFLETRVFCRMRIIGGSAKGHKLSLPKGRLIRPTTDRVREALFNILAPRIHGAAFLDLFCGSGSVGLEALSRGASLVVFVDNDSRSIATMKENLKKTGLPDEAVFVRKGDATQALNALDKKGYSFDIVFMDPPYAKGFVEPTLSLIGNTSLLRQDGLVVVEYGLGEEIPQRVGSLQLESFRQYGDSFLSFFRRSGTV